jgi:DNA-binding NtrC family response regulator
MERTKSQFISAQDIINCERIRPSAQDQAVYGLSLVNEEGLMRPMAELERDIIEFALQRSGGRVANVAQELGIARSTLYRKLESNGLNFSEIYSIAIGDAA